MSIPATWPERIFSFTGSLSLNVAGYSVTIEITAEQLARVYFPLLTELNDRARSGRILAGVAGVGGGGKSTFAAVVAHLAQQLLGPDHLVVVGMDGWHWPNRILDQRTTTVEGQTVPLRRRKGGPESFDVQSLILALRQLQRADGLVSIPVYDRQRHDPIPDSLTIPPQVRIVLIEGNYLLGGVEGLPQWDEVADLLHPKFYLECDADAARQRMIDRHIRGGASPVEAERKYAQNDQINAEIIRRSASRADMIVHLSPSPRLEPG